MTKLELDVSEYHIEMLDDLEKAGDKDVKKEIEKRVEQIIHKSYQESNIN